jgi:uncharacterized membrane protein
MKSATLAGIVLIVLGILSFAYQGISITTQKKVVDVGPIHATKDEKHTLPLPPILGGLLLIGGVALLLTSQRSAST